MAHHALNRDDGSRLPQDYLHFVANDAIPRVYKKQRWDFLLKILDWSVEMLASESNSTGLRIRFTKTRVASET